MVETLVILNIIRFILGLSILSFASYTDIKTRKASNILWIIMGIIGIILLLIQYFTLGFENLFYLLFIPIMIGLIYALYQLRLIFGGADAKAIMALAILVPIEPTIGIIPLWKDGIMPSSWTIFANSLILFLIIPISIFIYNATKKNVHIPYSFLGYKMNTQKAKEKFVWPIEQLVDGKRKFIYMPKDIDAKEEFEEFEKNNIKEIWVTPKIPFMVPLTFGFVFTFVFGDILFHLLSPFY